jgi:23S rRNA pseudouridine1911/1915/1917 synthase
MKSSDNEVLFCDNHLLIANKPAGLLTQPDDTGADSLERRMKAWVKENFKKPGNVFLHAIHRLDRPVSGLVLFARTSKALSRLNELLRNQEIQRVYTAEVEGVFPTREGRLDHYLVHGNHKAIVMSPSNPEAKHARLEFQVIEFLQRSTLVSVQLETGRYHQIRAQFGAAGHPIVGDRKYGAKTESEAICLHCSKIAFQHPVTKEMIEVQSTAPFA